MGFYIYFYKIAIYHVSLWMCLLNIPKCKRRKEEKVISIIITGKNMESS